MNIYELLSVKPGCSFEQITEAKQEFERRAKEYNVSEDWLKRVYEHYDLITRVGIGEYNRRIQIKKHSYSLNMPNVNIFDDAFFDEIKKNEEIDYTIKLLQERNRDKVINDYEERLALKSNRVKPKKTNFKVHKTHKKVQAKNVRIAPLAKVAVATGVVLVALTTLVTGCAKIDAMANIYSESPQETTVQNSNYDENLELINYKVKLGDTQFKIVNELNLNEYEASKIPLNIFEGEVYKVYVSQDIAQEYNYNNEYIKTFLCTYELEPGGTLYEIAKYAKDTYPQVFDNMSIGEIKEQIASDNGCTVGQYQAKTYVINCYKTQAELDKLAQMGVINTGRQF